MPGAPTHPGLLDLARTRRERDEAVQMPRDLTHPWVHVSYECDSHTHIVNNLKYDPKGSFGEFLEDSANDLAEAILRCEPSRHNGHGQHHDTEHAQKAYSAAVRQLQERDYYREFVELKLKAYHFALWGGHPPEVVLQPNPEDPSEWLYFKKDSWTGIPEVRRIGDVAEMGPPDPKKYARGKYGFYRRGR